MMKNRTISVMLVEDQPEYREVVEMAIDETPDLELISVFGTAEKALENLSDQSCSHPDIILLDLNLFGMGGIEALPYIKKGAANSKVIVLTNSDRESDILAAISKGASGYLLKSATVDEVVEGIRVVKIGGASLDPKMASYVLKSLRVKTIGDKEAIHLSKRKIEVLELIAEGLLKKEIAARLDIGYSTVETYVKGLYEDLGVSNAPSAVSTAYRKGLLGNNGKKM